MEETRISQSVHGVLMPGRVRFLPAVLLALASCFLRPTPSISDEQKYLYDSLGRLYQVVDFVGNTATYHWDPVGNLLAITRTNVQPPPVVTSISPSQARAGETVSVKISGNNLLGASLSTTHAGLSIAHVSAAPKQITATLTLAETSPQGVATIKLATSTGSATVGFVVLPPVPVLLLAPSQVTMNVGETMNLSVGLAQADPYDVPVELSVSDPAIASVSPSKVTIPAGQTSKSVTVKGLVYGTTVLAAEAGGKKSHSTLKIKPTDWLSTAVSVVLEDTGATSQGVSVVLEETGTVAGPLSVIIEDDQLYTPALAAPVSVKIGP